MTELLLARVRRLAMSQSQVVSRRQLRELDVPRWVVTGELRAGRWQRTGRHTVATHNGALDEAAQRTVCVLEAHPRAALDGIAALRHLGLLRLTAATVDVVVPKGARARRPRGVRVRESRRFREEDVTAHAGVRVVVPAVAAVHAALWARSDREARLVLVVVVQQRLVTPVELAAAASTVRRHARRRLLAETVAAVARGSRSSGELDVVTALRERGLPLPDQQVVRRRTDGTEVLDCRFEEYDLTLEIDGVQHDDAEHRARDLVRDWRQIAEGSSVLRLPLVVWTLDRGRVLDALKEVLRSRGWRPAA